MRRLPIARYLRTVGRLTAPQILHRLRLRSRSMLRKAFPDAAERGAARRAWPAPPVRRGRPPPLDILRPCASVVSQERAREAALGRFTFLGETRDLGLSPFPAPEDVSLLWAYHLEYMEYLLDLALAERWGAVERLVMSRLGTDSDPGRAGAHPYTEARKAAVWLQILPLAPEGLRRTLAEGVWRSLARVAANLEMDVGGNHLLENGLALVLGGARFLGRRSACLRRLGRRILLRGIREQVLPDGAHYELSPMYHARVLALAAESADALEGIGEEMPGWFWERLASMCSFLRGILDFQGRLPLLGDCARDAFLSPSLLLDAVERRLPVRVPAVSPGDRAYAQAGIFIFEDTERENRLILDAGRTCPVRLPAHGQADTFAVMLTIGGVEFITDAGLYEYAPGPMREWCRATRAHSTVEVDGEDSSEVWASFRVARGADVSESYWAPGDGLATFSGRHDGYRRLGVDHHRLVTHPRPGLWIICDRLSSAKPHRYVSRLHLHPESTAEDAGPGQIVVRRDNRELWIRLLGDGVVGWENGWHCPSFGEKRRSRLLTVTCEQRRARMGMVLSDRAVGEATIDASGQVRIATDTTVVVRWSA